MVLSILKYLEYFECTEFLCVFECFDVFLVFLHLWCVHRFECVMCFHDVSLEFLSVLNVWL